MERKVIAFLACALLISTLGLFFSGVEAQSPTAPAATNNLPPKKAEEQFKNIQVLKGMPAEQMIPTMQFITASLGVECDYCHVEHAFEKDDKKPKQTARKMMEMMIAINADNFESRRAVTCYSCHHGNTRPSPIPAVMSDDSSQASSAPHVTDTEAKLPETKKDSGPSAEQLLDGYVRALGGATAVDRVTSRVMKGTIDFGETSLPIEIYAMNPEKRISYSHMPGGDSITAFNGQEGWLSTPGRPLREMHGSDLDGAAIDADLHLATDFKSIFEEVHREGAERVGDHDTYVVVVNGWASRRFACTLTCNRDSWSDSCGLPKPRLDCFPRRSTMPTTATREE